MFHGWGRMYLHLCMCGCRLEQTQVAGVSGVSDGTAFELCCGVVQKGKEVGRSVGKEGRTSIKSRCQRLCPPLGTNVGVTVKSVADLSGSCNPERTDDDLRRRAGDLARAPRPNEEASCCSPAGMCVYLFMYIG
jgi:hypothetical protein